VNVAEAKMESIDKARYGRATGVRRRGIYEEKQQELGRPYEFQSQAEAVIRIKDIEAQKGNLETEDSRPKSRVEAGQQVSQTNAKKAG
jgi:hypothetical protein